MNNLNNDSGTKVYYKKNHYGFFGSSKYQITDTYENGVLNHRNIDIEETNLILQFFKMLVKIMGYIEGAILFSIPLLMILWFIFK